MSSLNRPNIREILDSEGRETLGMNRISSSAFPREKSTPSRRWTWMAWVVLLLFLALTIMLGAGIIGYLDGLRDREENLRVQSLEHYRRGVTHMQAGEFELAAAELEESLRLQPGLAPAWDKLRETQMRLATIPTPTSVPFPSPSPDPSPESGTSFPEPSLLEQARALHAEGDYAGTIAVVDRLMQAETDELAEEVEELLFDSYARLAKKLLAEERLEEAIRMLDHALLLRPEEGDLEMERDLAVLYMEGLGYWGADWEEAITRFRRLHDLNPDFLDTADRLFGAHYRYADFLNANGDPCIAETWYRSALELRHDSELAEKMRNAADQCARLPTGTQEPATESETPAATSTSPIAQDLRALGLRGTIYYSIWDNVRREYALYQIAADGTGKTQIIAGMHQPQVNWQGTHLIARARSGVPTLGLYLIELTGEETPPISLVTSHVDDLYASFSPNGQQVVFASNRMSQRLWTLFTTWVDEEDDLTAVTVGHTPAWSPNSDRIAFKGCDEQGNNCGIYTIAANGLDKRRLVADPSAGFPAWSPDGKQIAYMSNREGTWDIYIVGADGSGLKRLTRSSSSDGLPAWSPDGRGVAYLSHRDQSWGIYLQRVDSGEVALLVKLETTYSDWLMESIAWGPAR